MEFETWRQLWEDRTTERHKVLNDKIDKLILLNEHNTEEIKDINLRCVGRTGIYASMQQHMEHNGKEKQYHNRLFDSRIFTIAVVILTAILANIGNYFMRSINDRRNPADDIRSVSKDTSQHRGN